MLQELNEPVVAKEPQAVDQADSARAPDASEELSADRQSHETLTSEAYSESSVRTIDSVGNDNDGFVDEHFGSLVLEDQGSNETSEPRFKNQSPSDSEELLDFSIDDPEKIADEGVGHEEGDAPERKIDGESSGDGGPDSKEASIASTGILASALLGELLRRGPRAENEARAEVRITLGDSLLQPGTDIYFDKDGSVVENPASEARNVRVSLAEGGRLSIEPLTKDTTVHIKGSDGKVREVKPFTGPATLSPGESFSTGQADFIDVGSRALASHLLRFEVGGRFDKEVTLEMNDVVEIGRGHSRGYQPTENADGRLDLLNESVSRRHASIGLDANGLYIVDGGPIKGSTEVIPSSNGTWVNGKRLEPGQRQYLKPTDKISLNDPSLYSSVPITMKEAPIETGKTEPESTDKSRGKTTQSRVSELSLRSGDREISRILRPNQEITIGTEGHMDVGGRHLAPEHAKLRIDANGNTFIKVLPQAEGQPDARLWIERADGTNLDVKAADGWIPLGVDDKVSAGGSEYFGFSEKTASPLRAVVQGQSREISPGTRLQLGRLESSFLTPEGVEIVQINNDRVSSVHANLGVDAEGRMYVEDIGKEGKGSTNGTYVNGVRLKPNTKRYLRGTDIVHLGNPQSSDTPKINLKEIGLSGDRLVDGRPENAPVARTDKLAPWFARNTVESVDPSIPTDLRASYVVGHDGRSEIRIVGGLGKELPHESFVLSPGERQGLGSEKSAYEAIDLDIRGKKHTYYRSRENNSRFYVLAEGGREGAKLVRDYEIVVTPDSGTDGATNQSAIDRPRNLAEKTSELERSRDTGNPGERSSRGRDGQGSPAPEARQESSRQSVLEGLGSGEVVESGDYRTGDRPPRDVRKPMVEPVVSETGSDGTRQFRQGEHRLDVAVGRELLNTDEIRELSERRGELERLVERGERLSSEQREELESLRFFEERRGDPAVHKAVLDSVQRSGAKRPEGGFAKGSGMTVAASILTASVLSVYIASQETDSQRPLRRARVR